MVLSARLRTLSDFANSSANRIKLFSFIGRFYPFDFWFGGFMFDPVPFPGMGLFMHSLDVDPQGT